LTAAAGPAQAFASSRQAAEEAARRSYGRLVAWLAWQWRDIAAAEDALSEAFVAALAQWPQAGVPESPEGWLLTAAKRNLLKAARRQRQAEDPTLTVLWPDAASPAPETAAIPDSRLRLMFVCAHPAIDPAIRAALILQTVLGLEAARIAPAFLVSAEAMTKRLVRAKAKIKASRIRFEEPEGDELPERLQAVLEALYAAYSVGAGDASPDDPEGLAQEALFLAALVSEQLPNEPEALGLHALILLCEARRPARLDALGDFVPLDRQDTRRWRRPLIEQAGRCLQRAVAVGPAGPFQLEAAIQAAHCHRAFTGEVPWSEVAVLYERLIDLAPTIGARIGQAVAIAQALNDPAAGLARLREIEPTRVAEHQPWWAACAHLHAQAGEAVQAAAAYERALALTVDVAIRRHLERRRAEVGAAGWGAQGSM
jgi:RNA polymerase sigma-70 factor (ECF subfamily)